MYHRLSSAASARSAVSLGLLNCRCMEVLPGIHMVPNIRWSRVYLIEGETLVLVDTGLLGGARKV